MTRGVSDLLRTAAAAREAGERETAARLYDEAVDESRAHGDLTAWAEAALGGASMYLFGAEPGKVPAQLHEVLEQTTDEATRARLAAALARCWSYAGQHERGLPFAELAVHSAELVGAPELIADCLDALLAVRWGPDDIEPRRALVLRLDAVAAHLLDPEARLKAHLWGLQMACDVLDLHAVRRHLRALESLGQDSARAQFFAATRRLMLDLLHGRTDTTPALLRAAAEAGHTAGLPDSWMVLESQKAYSAAQTGDRATCAEVAAEAESFGLAEGIPAVCAEAAFLWTIADEPDRAAALVATFRGSVLDDLPKDVNWLLTLQCTLEAALYAGDRELIAAAARLLAPYTGRAVFNAGAIMFHGVTDDTLSRAADFLGDAEGASRLRNAARATYDHVGATWWKARLTSGGPAEASAVAESVAYLCRTPGGPWLVGTGDAPAPVKELIGLRHLAQLVRHPHQPITALDLAGGGTGVLAEAGMGDVVDRQALSAYRQRLLDLDSELREAEEWEDRGRISLLTSERHALLDELGRVTGLAGRIRFTGSSAERARVAVTKAITTAITRIATVDEPLARHLRTCVHTGLLCSYEPEAGRSYDWVLTVPDHRGGSSGSAALRGLSSGAQ